MIKKILKINFALIILILLWFCCAWLLPKIKTNPKASNSSKTISIYVKSNGVHTDIVMPINTTVYNWNTFVSKNCFLDIDDTYQYLAIGWGDK